jgi:hypothetical protein
MGKKSQVQIKVESSIKSLEFEISLLKDQLEDKTSRLAVLTDLLDIKGVVTKINVINDKDQE